MHWINIGFVWYSLSCLTAIYICAERFNLRQNKLTGKIPSELSRLTRLIDMVLHTNALTGPIPKLSNLTKLTSLNLDGNKLTGPIPSGVSKLTLLESLHLIANELSGTLPDLSNLTNLREMNVRDNSLVGTLSTSIGLVGRALTSLKVNGNFMSGTIPSEMGLLTSLVELNLENNVMEGEIPSEIFNLGKSLKILSIGNGDGARGNTFRSVIPSEIGFMTNLGT